MTNFEKMRALLTTAISLLEVSGPNPMLVDETEYFEELHRLYKDCGLTEEE